MTADGDVYREELLAGLSAGERKVLEAVRGILAGELGWPKGDMLHGYVPTEVHAHTVHEIGRTGLSRGSIERHLRSLARKNVLDQDTTWRLGVFGRVD